MKKTYIIFATIIILLLIFFSILKKNKIKTYVNKNLINSYYDAIIDNRYFLNDYNTVFLPKTQFDNLNIVKLKVITSKNNTQKNPKFIEVTKNFIFIVDSDGNFFQANNDNFLQTNNKDQFKPINNNTKDLGLIKVLGSLSDNNEIYISYVKKINDKCKTFSVAKSTINTNNLNFNDIMNINECVKGPVYGGKIKLYNHQNKSGLLITTSDTIMQDDLSDLRAQDTNSLFNKIIFFDFEKKEKIIFSKGHRNPAGLYVDNKLILATEHGPRGGDEINKIIFNKNYGWPVSSYGELYRKQSDNFDDEPFYKKNHKKYNFEEPIFSFVPSIAISEIIKIPNNFSKQWQDNFLIGSLNGRSLYRLKFDENYNKILFIEKIYIGKRIRDLKYNPNTNSIILAFDEDYELFFLNKK
jgi:hypothetical protein